MGQDNVGAEEDVGKNRIQIWVWGDCVLENEKERTIRKIVHLLHRENLDFVCVAQTLIIPQSIFGDSERPPFQIPMRENFSSPSVHEAIVTVT